MRRTLTSLLLLCALNMPTPATARDFEIPRPYVSMRVADQRAVRALLSAYRDWLDGLAWAAWLHALEDRQGDYDVGDGRRYTGPECSGEWAVPTWIVWRESRCSYTAENPTSSASGAYQFIDGTWNIAVRGAGLSQYAGHASWAPAWVQDEAAEWLWDDGRGASHWSTG